jgi:hypothetical protein
MSYDPASSASGKLEMESAEGIQGFHTCATGDLCIYLLLSSESRIGVWYVLWQAFLRTPDISERLRTQMNHGSTTQNQNLFR